MYLLLFNLRAIGFQQSLDYSKSLN
uniref:Uncharacterized protein n=1 Tax=Arundo donax TaxID=35708 RepID=A0A0A9B022_ARUDO